MMGMDPNAIPGGDQGTDPSQQPDDGSKEDQQDSAPGKKQNKPAKDADSSKQDNPNPYYNA